MLEGAKAAQRAELQQVEVLTWPPNCIAFLQHVLHDTCSAQAQKHGDPVLPSFPPNSACFSKGRGGPCTQQWNPVASRQLPICTRQTAD